MLQKASKGQLYSEWSYEVIISPKIPTKIFRDFCPTKQTKIVAEKTEYTHQKIIKKVSLEGQKSGKFWLAFWEKQWPQKFI